MHDQFDVSLEDSDLLVEVELTTSLIIAASEAEEHLSQEEIDRILGLLPEAPAAAGADPAEAAETADPGGSDDAADGAGPATA